MAFEMFVLGNNAKQGKALESWRLGMCLLHACSSGEGPYEDVLKRGGVLCPGSLRDELREVWKDDKYTILSEVVGKPEPGDQEEDESVFHTIYGLCVIFGVEESVLKAKVYKDNPVMQLIAKHLLGRDNTSQAMKSPHVRRTGRKVKSTTDSVTNFGKHRSHFGLTRDDKGSPINPYFARVQAVLHESEGLDLLFRLCHFDPEKRMSTEEALLRPFFESLLADEHGSECGELDSDGEDSSSANVVPLADGRTSVSGAAPHQVIASTEAVMTADPPLPLVDCDSNAEY